MKRMLPTTVFFLRGDFQRDRAFWKLVHYICGVGSIALAAYASVLAKQGQDVTFWNASVGFLAALVTFSKASVRAAAYSRALRKLEAGISKFELGEAFSEQDFVPIIEEARQEIDTDA